MRFYYGLDIDEGRMIFATVTGEMSDGTLVYTEVETDEDGDPIKENGYPKIILGNQYIARRENGSRHFYRI